MSETNAISKAAMGHKGRNDFLESFGINISVA